MPDAIATDPTEYFDEHNQLHPHRIRLPEGRPTRIARIRLLPGHYVIHAKGVVFLDEGYQGPATTATLRLQEGNTPNNNTPSDSGQASLVPGRDGSWPVDVATIPLLLATRIQKETDYMLWASATNSVPITVSSY